MNSHLFFIAAAFAALSAVVSCNTVSNAPDALKPRIVVCTDIGPAEVEPDDNESAVRLLSYADRFEIEAIITTIGWNCDPYPEEWAEYLYRVIDGYSVDVANLMKRSGQEGFLSREEEEGTHSLGYWPSAEYIRGRSVMGSSRAGIGVIGEGNDSPGSDLLIKLADEDDPRPIWVCSWGGANTLSQAIWRVQQERSPEDLKAFLDLVHELFVNENTVEFTVEGGRPETITAEKLQIIKEAGAGRISINPQSMKQRTLDLIGRRHSPEQIREAFALAKEAQIPVVNADLITGLPEEEPEDFRSSLAEVIGLGPANITVHTLAVKKASRMIEEDPGVARRQADNVRQMLDDADRMLTEAGYEPYYMYRQKHMAGNFENVGWCLPGTESLYNIRIMEEDQTIVAMGAGAISKVYFPAENRLERVPNVSNYQIYIERIEEMIARKEAGLL